MPKGVYALQIGAGPCDKKKKPSYCSRACQKHDINIHKPFCRAGAPCSITKADALGDVIIANAPPREPGAGLLFLPMTHPDGNVTLLSTGTLEPDDLYDLEDELLAEGRNPGPVYGFDMFKE